MKIVIAPDKFKGTFTAAQIAAAMAVGIGPGHTFILKPMADGGEGTVAAFAALKSTRLITRRVIGPLPEQQVEATFALLENQTAVIETAAASGLALLDPLDRNPLATTTFGTGQLIAAAIKAGAKTIILGLGGTATVDAGLGALQACGFTILTTDGEPISPTDPLCGRDIGRVLSVKHGRGEITSGIEIIAAADAMVPLLGPTGAAILFAPQKGADPATVKQLEQDLKTLVTRSITSAAADTPGAGAAGGLGYAVVAFFRGTILPGFSIVARAVGLEQSLDGADLCITGEGRLDAQSSHGKVVAGVAAMCRSRNIPCVAIVGSAEPGIAIHGLNAVFQLEGGTRLPAVEAAANRAARWAEKSPGS